LSSKKKIRIELEDDEGSKYNLSLEGNFSKEKILKVIELMELVRSNSTADLIANSNEESNNNRTLSVDSKIWSIIEQSFSYTTFTSSDIVNVYNKKYNETIKLSIISTYLSRYATKGKLKRAKRLREYVYDLARTASANTNSITTNIISSNTDEVPATPDNDNTKIVYDVRRKTIDDLKN
jgi:PIN domain nuclease of toxin-antitoxin system